MEQTHGGQDAADVHFDLAVGGAPQGVLRHLQGKEAHAQQAVDDLCEAGAGPPDPRDEVAETEAGQAEEPGVAHVPHGHVGFGLEEVDPRRKEEVAQKCHGDNDPVPPQLPAPCQQVMHQGHGEQGYEEPHLGAYGVVGDGGVLKEEAEPEQGGVVVEQGGQQPAHAGAVHQVGDHLVHRVQNDAYRQVGGAPLDEAGGAGLGPLRVGGVKEVPAHEEEHGHRQAVQGVHGVILPHQVNADDHVAQEKLEEIEIDIPSRGFGRRKRHVVAPPCVKMRRSDQRGT